MSTEPRYEVLKILGQGAFGTVYLALDVSTQRKVALKRQVKKGKELPREFEMLSLVKDARHCVQLLDCFLTEERKGELVLNYAFELMEGDLNKIITNHIMASQALPERLIKFYAYQIFKGLDEVHKRNVMHRDLKPENILWRGSELLKISDFGSAKVVEPGAASTPYVVSRYYRAPELILMQTDYDCKVDIWAAGCIVAELALLQPLFRGASDGGQLFAIMDVLGPFAPRDREYYRLKAPRLQDILESCIEVPRDEAKLGELYSRFKDGETAKLFFESVLEYNPTKRPSASQALGHPFFESTKFEYREFMSDFED